MKPRPTLTATREPPFSSIALVFATKPALTPSRPTVTAERAAQPLPPGRLNAIIESFDGYTDTQASEKKILRDVFKPGDA